MLEAYSSYSRFINIFFWLFMVVMNILISASVFNNENNSTISKDHPTLFTPAGYAFSIWGLIFSFLGIFCLFQFFGGDDKEKVPVIVNVLFQFNLFCNGVWGVAFSYKIFWLSVLIMLCLLVSLILIHKELHIGRDLFKPKSRPSAQYIFKLVNARRFYWAVMFPFSLYLGWISVATIANFSIFFSAEPISWTSGAEVWSIIMQVVAASLAVIMIIRESDMTFAGVVAWALIAIGVKQKPFESVSNCGYILGGLLWVLVLLGIVYQFFAKKQEKGSTSYEESSIQEYGRY
jgi:translocator protein